MPRKAATLWFNRHVAKCGDRFLGHDLRGSPSTSAILRHREPPGAAPNYLSLLPLGAYRWIGVSPSYPSGLKIINFVRIYSSSLQHPTDAAAQVPFHMLLEQDGKQLNIAVAAYVVAPIVR